MADDRGPHGDAEKVPDWWESLSEDDRLEVREALDGGGDLPARLAISLSKAGITVGPAQFGPSPVSPASPSRVPWRPMSAA